MWGDERIPGNSDTSSRKTLQQCHTLSAHACMAPLAGEQSTCWGVTAPIESDRGTPNCLHGGCGRGGGRGEAFNMAVRSIGADVHGAWGGAGERQHAGPVEPGGGRAAAAGGRRAAAHAHGRPARREHRRQRLRRRGRHHEPRGGVLPALLGLGIKSYTRNTPIHTQRTDGSANIYTCCQALLALQT